MSKNADRWQLQVCKNYLSGSCMWRDSLFRCPFAHITNANRISHGHVRVCTFDVKGKCCERAKCPFYHEFSPDIDASLNICRAHLSNDCVNGRECTDGAHPPLSMSCTPDGEVNVCKRNTFKRCGKKNCSEYHTTNAWQAAVCAQMPTVDGAYLKVCRRYGSPEDNSCLEVCPYAHTPHHVQRLTITNQHIRCVRMCLNFIHFGCNESECPLYHPAPESILPLQNQVPRPHLPSDSEEVNDNTIPSRDEISAVSHAPNGTQPTHANQQSPETQETQEIQPLSSHHKVDTSQQSFPLPHTVGEAQRCGDGPLSEQTEAPEHAPGHVHSNHPHTDYSAVDLSTFPRRSRRSSGYLSDSSTDMPHAIYIVDESEEAPPSAFTRESPHRHTLTSTHHNAPHSYERQLSWDGDQSYGRAINRIKLEVGAASPREAVEGWGGADCGPGGTTLTPQDVSTDGAVVQADDAAGDIPAESGAQDNTCSNTHAKNRAQDNTHGTTHDDNTLHAKAMPVTDHTRVYLGVGTNHTSMTHIKIEPEPHPATSEQAHEGAEVRAKLDVGGSTAHGGGVKQEQDRPLTTDRGQRDGTHDRTDSGGGETVPERKTYAIDKDSAGGAVGLAGAQPLAKRTATTIRLSKETGQDQSDKERKRQRALRFNMDRKPSPSSHRTGPGAGAGAGPMDLVPQAEGEERRERDMRNHGNETPGNHGDNDRRRHGEREHPDLADDNLDQRIAELEKEMALRAKSRSVMSRSDSRSELQRRRSQSSAQRDMSLQTRHGDRGDERGRDRERDRERDRDKDRDRDTARDRDDDRPAHSQHSSGVAGKRRLSQTERRGGEAYDRNDRDSSERRGRDSHARTDRHAHTHRSSRSSTRGISPAHARGASRSRTVSHTFNDGRRNSKHGARSVGSHTDEPTHAQADPRNSDQLVFKAAPMLSGSSHSSGGEEEDRRGSDNERGVGVSGYTMTVALKGEPFPVRLPSQTTSHAHTHPHKRLRRDSTVVADVHAQPSGGTRKGKGTPYTTKAHDSYDPDSTHMTAPAPADAPTGAHGLTLGGVCAAMCTAADAQGPNATDDDVIADTPAVLYTACPAFLQNTCVSAMCTRPHPPPCVMPYMATVLGLNKEGATARAVLDMLVQSVKVGIAVTIQACPYLSNGRACISTPCRYYHPEDRVTRKQPLIETGSGSHDNGDNVQQIACAHTTADKETDQAPASSAPAMAGRSQTSMNDTTNDRATATTQQHPAQLQTHTAHTQAQPTQATTAQGHPPQQHTVSNVHMDSKRDSDVARMVLPHSEAKARQYTRWSTQTDKPGFSQPVKTEFTHPKVDTYPSPRRSSLSNYQAHVDTLRPPQDPRQNTATQPQQHPEEAKQPIQRSNTNTHTHQHSEVSRQSSLQRSNTHTHTQQSPQTQIPPQERRSEERARYAQGHTAQPRDYLKQARDYRDSSGDPKDGPLLRREERSINSRDDRSINNREDHINSRDDRIINSREDRINSRDDRYISSREDRAINSRGDRSINSRENRAINNGEQGAKPRPLLDNPPARYRDNQRYHRFSNETNPDFDKNLEFTPKRPRIEADLNPSDPFTAPQSGQRFHMSPNPTQEHSPSCEARGLSADRAPYRQDDRAPAPGHVQDRAGGSSNDCRGELAPNFSTTDWRVREHSAERGRARTRDRSRPPPSPGDLRSRLKSPNATYRS